MCFRDMPWHEGHYATDRLHRSRTGFCPDYRVCFPESLQVAGFLTLPPARAESSSINRKPRCAKESRMRATIIAGENLWTFVKRERTSSRSQGSILRSVSKFKRFPFRERVSSSGKGFIIPRRSNALLGLSRSSNASFLSWE